MAFCLLIHLTAFHQGSESLYKVYSKFLLISRFLWNWDFFILNLKAIAIFFFLVYNSMTKIKNSVRDLSTSRATTVHSATPLTRYLFFMIKEGKASLQHNNGNLEATFRVSEKWRRPLWRRHDDLERCRCPDKTNQASDGINTTLKALNQESRGNWKMIVH